MDKQTENRLCNTSSLLPPALEILDRYKDDPQCTNKGRLLPVLSNSVALLHRMLYEGQNMGEVEVSAYIRSLAEEIQYSAGRKMEIELELPEKLELKIEKVTVLV